MKNIIFHNNLQFAYKNLGNYILYYTKFISNSVIHAFLQQNISVHKLYYQNHSNLIVRSLATFSFGGKRKRCTKEKPPSDVICLNLQQITV